MLRSVTSALVCSSLAVVFFAACGSPQTNSLGNDQMYGSSGATTGADGTKDAGTSGPGSTTTTNGDDDTGSTTGGMDAATSGDDSDGSSTMPIADAAPDAPAFVGPAPAPSGCITDVTPGDHVFTCNGLSLNVSVPDTCTKAGCGLILEMHGDTGTGPLIDQHLQLMALGKTRGYVVLAPTGEPWQYGGGGNTWTTNDDATVLSMIESAKTAWSIDPKRVHMTGFSRGGFVTWRFLCDHADLFSSVAPGAAGWGECTADNAATDVACDFSSSQMPSRQIDVMYMIGIQDAPIPYSCAQQIRDAAISAWSLGTGTVVDSKTNEYTHTRYTSNGSVFETYIHNYTTDPKGPWGDAVGHCIPGSNFPVDGPQYAVPCEKINGQANAFTWGEVVMDFFQAHEHS